VQNTPGNSIRIFRSNFVTLREVRALWTDFDTCPTDPGADNSCAQNGAYGLYPVECRHVLIEDSESFGASDAGIYVGQTSDVIVRRTRAEYNVAGFEFENTYRAVFEDNIATNNTGGFLVFDLPGLSQYGQKNVVRRNKSFNNNTPNFAPVGNIVGLTPRGTGMLILASDQLEVYENEIYDNDTVGIALVNFALADPAQPDRKYDFYPEGVHIHHNVFRNNGGNTQEPDLNRGEGSLFPLLLRLKNLGKPAHIVWDGAVDSPNGCTEVPKDQDGVALNQANPQEDARGEARTDERGRPNYQRSDPEPSCKYNAWKFDQSGALKQPENGLCVEDNNTFENTTPQTMLADPFLNAKLTSSDPAQLVQDLLVPASNDLTPHRCTLSARPAPTLQLPFRPNPASGEARPSQSQVNQACNAGRAGQVNFDALLKYNCPR
ncbi:MAG: parallel beta-helix domain-containing protein, partial [Burkholderiales bacterium]